MSPLIAVPEHITQARLMRPRALYGRLSRREYVSMHRST
jgi:hypothetical protein